MDCYPMYVLTVPVMWTTSALGCKITSRAFLSVSHTERPVGLLKPDSRVGSIKVDVHFCLTVTFLP